MAGPVTLRTDAGDEQIDLAEFEARIQGGEISPQCLVRLEAVTGPRWVAACELELYRRLSQPRRASFSRRFSLARFPWLTSGFILVNLAVFVGTAQNGTLELDDMVRFGGKVGPLITDLGQLWRLLTANLLHRDAVHIGLNMFVLFNVGGAMENTYRTFDYVWLLVFSGVSTMTASLLLSDSVTIGASGLVFGCLGGIVAFGLKYRAILPAAYRNIMGDAAIPTVLGLLLIGLTSPGVDSWAHLGGLVAGLASGAVMRPRLLTEVGSRWGVLLHAAPTMAIVLLACVGHPLLRGVLPLTRLENDDAFGVSVQIPRSWVRGATPLGSVAWYNGLTGFGRASFAAEAVEMPEGGDARASAQTFIEQRLVASSLGPEVAGVRHEPLEPGRIAERDGVWLKAGWEEPWGSTRLLAAFVPRGTVVYQLVFTWPSALPGYAQVVRDMAAGVRFEEPQALRQARADALLFPNSPPLMARLGGALLQQGHAVAASQALAAAVRGEPGTVTYRVALARAYLASGEVDRGCESARSALAYAPDDAEALETDARCELAKGNPAAALERLSQARAAAPLDERLKAAESKLRASLGHSP